MNADATMDALRLLFVRRLCVASASQIDEYRLYYVPIFLGSGKAAFSQIQNSVKLKPIETRTFSSGTVRLRCALVTP